MRMNKGDFALKGCDNVGEHVQVEGGPAQPRGRMMMMTSRMMRMSTMMRMRTMMRMSTIIA